MATISRLLVCMSLALTNFLQLVLHSASARSHLNSPGLHRADASTWIQNGRTNIGMLPCYSYTTVAKYQQCHVWRCAFNACMNMLLIVEYIVFSDIYPVRGISKSFRNHPKVNEPEISFLYLIHKTSLQSHYAKLRILPTFYCLSIHRPK